MEIRYEHHTTIRQDKQCPFKLGDAERTLPAPSNWHENIEILYTTSGEGKIQYGRTIYPLSPGDITVINSGVLHRPYTESDIDYYFIIIDEVFCKENGLDTSRIQFCEHFCDEKVALLFEEAVAAIQAYEASPSALSTARTRLSVLALLLMLCERYSVPKEAKETPPSLSEIYVKRVIEYINEKYTERITLDELSMLCGITKFHLAREFKRITGQTVFSYINTLRCKKAEALIVAGKSTTEAALESGFESLSYFSRTYKNLMGASPSKIKSHTK